MDQGIIYYSRSYKKVFAILSDVFPILNFLLLVFKKFTRIVKLTFAKKYTSELLFENVQSYQKLDKKLILNGNNKKIKKKELNDILSINIRRNSRRNESLNQNYHTNVLHYNDDSRKLSEQKNSISKEYNNTAEKRPSFLLLNKNDNTQSRTHLNDVNLLGILNMKQLKRKNTVIGGKRNTISLGMDYPLTPYLA